MDLSLPFPGQRSFDSVCAHLSRAKRSSPALTPVDLSSLRFLTFPYFPFHRPTSLPSVKKRENRISNRWSETISTPWFLALLGIFFKFCEISCCFNYFFLLHIYIRKIDKLDSRFNSRCAVKITIFVLDFLNFLIFTTVKLVKLSIFSFFLMEVLSVRYVKLVVLKFSSCCSRENLRIFVLSLIFNFTEARLCFNNSFFFSREFRCEIRELTKICRSRDFEDFC